jgi:hypothetical protein
MTWNFWKPKSRWIRWLEIGVNITLFVYVASYVIDSGTGGYYLVAEMDGKVRWRPEYGGLAFPSAILWQPRFGHDALANQDWLGWTYHPLIEIDRKYVHRTKYLVGPSLSLVEGTAAMLKWLDTAPLSEIHPDFRERVLKERLTSRTTPTQNESTNSGHGDGNHN